MAAFLGATAAVVAARRRATTAKEQAKEGPFSGGASPRVTTRRDDTESHRVKFSLKLFRDF